MIAMHQIYILKCIFLNENCCILSQLTLEWSNQQYVIIGADNGVVSNGRQAIIWTNDGLVYWRISASLGFDQLRYVNVK